jgi:hypothetical protein
MSFSDLTADERATYLMGLAVRRQLEQAPRDPATEREIETLGLWAQHWLTRDEIWQIAAATGFVLCSPDFLYEQEGPGPPLRDIRSEPFRPGNTTGDDSDDIPF